MLRSIVVGVAMLLLMACVKRDSMELTILNRRVLEGIPSASGIEMLKGTICVIGDNSPWIFELNSNHEIVDKLQIISGHESVDGLIPKKNKPDFEAIARGTRESGEILFVFGSGSKSPERDLMVRVDCADTTRIRSYSLEEFYKKMKRVAKLSNDDLNIEGAVVEAGELYLFNRGINMVLNYKMKDFMEHIEGKRTSPEPAIYQFNLPRIDGIEAGFSGAGIIPGKDKIVFTASVENTSNWIDDGPVLGSFVGVIDLKELGKSLKPECVRVVNEGKSLNIKIESVTTLSSSGEGEIHLLLVTDSDGGDSEMIEAVLRL
jgi:hypothetical protein